MYSGLTKYLSVVVFCQCVVVKYRTSDTVMKKTMSYNTK